MLTTEQAWEHHGKELKGFIISRVKDPDTTEDILQEVFVKVHLNLHTVKNEDRLRAWIYQVTRNAIQDHFRKQRFSLDIEKIDLPAEAEDTNESALAGCMQPFIEKLPEKYREALIFSDLKNVSQKKLAEKFSISYSGVKSRVQRARQLLQSYFTDCCEISTDKYGNVISHAPKRKCLCAC